jgi:hypothetical protein
VTPTVFPIVGMYKSESKIKNRNKKHSAQLYSFFDFSNRLIPRLGCSTRYYCADCKATQYCGWCLEVNDCTTNAQCGVRNSTWVSADCPCK